MAAPEASQSLVDAAAQPRAVARPAPPLDPRRRRISYFMLVRLVMLALFTGVAAILAWRHDQDFTALHHGFTWGTLVTGYGLTIVFARQLPRVRDLDRFAWLQTTTDIVLVAVVVQMTGGTDSGFVSLYLIAVLGAATMGGVRETWAAAGACVMIYGTTTACEAMGILEPMSLGETVRALPPDEAALAFGRTVAGMAGVTVLSSFLNRQLASSALQVGDLRALNENILRSLGSGLIATDTEDRILYFNPNAQALLGLGRDDLQRPLVEVMPGVEPLLADAAGPSTSISTSPSAALGVTPGHAELELTTRAGERVHVRLHCSRLRDGRGRPVGHLVSFEDVTRMHELAEQVKRSERLAAVGGLAASVAHEIRNPLAAISGSAELLGTVPLEEDDARLVEIIRRESTRLSGLISEMLAFTRPRKPQRRAVPLARIAREGVENFRADPANARIEVALRTDEAPLVQVDPAQLSQVLWNLLRNAAEAMEGDGRVELRVRPRPADGAVELTVTDDGPGIPPQLRARVFDPFFTTKERGTGFGLAVVHRVVEDNGGSIELSTAPGEGTTFHLRFPAVDEPDSVDDSVDDSNDAP
ncbi:MAG: PAS domain-containing protein, partial [Myxococcales bacterium]|nr:PAS domain-containing protein [Myxococcales bacterium]